MKVTWMQAMLMLLVPASALVSGCADDPSEPDAPLIVANATIERKLAVDGCDYLVTIDDVRYAPDAESRVRIDDSELSSEATVTIGYRLTGETGLVECGDRNRLLLPEISLDLARTLSGQ